MFTDPAFLAAAFIAVLLVGLAKGGFAGVGMAATPLLALIMPPLQALAILLPILMMQDVISVWWYRRDWDAWNLKVMLPGAVVGIALAWALASRGVGRRGAAAGRRDRRAVRAQRLVRQDAADRAGRAPRAACSGAARSAFTSTIASAGMPPFSGAHAAAAHGQAGLVGTVTIFFAAVNLMRVVPYFGLGQLTRETLLISLALLPLAIATNFLGIWLVQRIPTGLFYRITYALMFLISVALLAQGVVGLLRGWAILPA